MENAEKMLVVEAQKRNAVIKPLDGCNSLESCFTREGNRIIFWFLTQDDSSHVLIADAGNDVIETCSS